MFILTICSLLYSVYSKDGGGGVGTIGQSGELIYIRNMQIGVDGTVTDVIIGVLLLPLSSEREVTMYRVGLRRRTVGETTTENTRVPSPA